MPRLVWDKPGSRKYESGLDRGVLYLPDGSGVPWNGLTEVVDKVSNNVSPLYYDGLKIRDAIDLGEFKATLKAITYPDEFEDLEGSASIRNGVRVDSQMPQLFALCYRTKIGNDLSGDEAFYKIHIIYNIVATPSDKTYNSISNSPEIAEFEWSLSTIPEQVHGKHPTSHITIDTRKIDKWLLEDLEASLYGSASAEATLMSMQALITWLSDWYRVAIVDNGDGTWTATESRPGFITFSWEEGWFMISNVNGYYVSDVEYVITDTDASSDIPRIAIHDNGDGTWTAYSDDANTIVMVTDGEFEIRTIDVIFSGPEMYRIQSMYTN
jgi:hypothetical protein